MDELFVMLRRRIDFLQKSSRDAHRRQLAFRLR